MKRMKKLLAFLLAAMLLLSMIPISASAYGAQTVQNDLLSVEYTHIDSDAVAHSDITVQIQLPDGSSYENNLILDNAQRSDTLTFSVKDGTEYEIDEVISIDDCSLINTTLSSKEAKYQFNQEVGDGVHIERTATIRVILAPKFVSPEYPNDKVEGSAVSIQYYAYDHELLKMLKMAGVSVDETTKINDISFHFVNDLSPADIDRGLVNTDDTVGYLPHWYTTISDAAKKGNPENIRYLEITYTPANGEKTTAKIYSGDLAYNKISSTAYSVESNDDSLAAVAFYSQDAGATNTWTLHDLHFVEPGDNFADHKMPSDPTYGGNITFVNWDHYEDGGDPFLPYEDINEDTVLYGQVLVAGYQGGTVLHVMNTENALLDRYLELYQSQEGADQNTTINDVQIDTIMVSSATQEKNTNPDFRENGWNDGHTHYVVHNREVPGSAAEGWNHHIALTDIASVTINGKVGDEEFKVEIPVSENPGDFSVVSVDGLGGGVTGIIVELIINSKPADPDDDDWNDPDDEGADDLYAQTGVKVECVNTENTHGNETVEYDLISKEGTKKWSADKKAYVYEIEVEPDAYVDKYNYTNGEHELTTDSPKSGTIVLVFENGKWSAVEDKDTVKFTVTCKDEEGPGGGDDDPNAPDAEDIIAALGKGAVKVECDNTKHTDSEKTYDLEEGMFIYTAEKDGEAYKVTITLDGDDYLVKYNEEVDPDHTLVKTEPESVDVTFTPKGEEWTTSDVTKPLFTVTVLCKDGGDEPVQPGEDDEKPDLPTDNELKALLDGKITVKCVNGDADHDYKTKIYGFLENGIALNALDQDEDGTSWTTEITIIGAVYSQQYSEDVGDAHKLTSGQDKSPTIQLKWAPNEDDPEGGSWTLDDPNATVIFKVTCDVKTVTTPGGTIVIEKDPEDPTDPDQTGVADLLETDDHIQYLFGYPDGSFGPDRNMTRAEAAQMFYNLLKNQNVDAEPAFDDVPDGAWYATAVNIMAELDIVNGVGDDKFEPNREITRAEFTTMAMRFADVPSGGVNIFTDVAPSDWFYSYVVNSIQYGWIEGYGDGTFRPDRLITRAEVTTIVNRMLDRQADMAYVIQHRAELNQFTDLTTEHWAYYTIVEATNEHDYKKPAIGEDWTSLKK